MIYYTTSLSSGKALFYPNIEKGPVVSRSFWSSTSTNKGGALCHDSSELRNDTGNNMQLNPQCAKPRRLHQCTRLIDYRKSLTHCAFNGRGKWIRTTDIRYQKPLFYHLNYTPIEIGRHCRIRTCDPMVPNHVFYQTELNADLHSLGALKTSTQCWNVYSRTPKECPSKWRGNRIDWLIQQLRSARLQPAHRLWRRPGQQLQL